MLICFPLTKAIPIMFEHVTTHNEALQPLISHNTTCYNNFNALAHALSHALPYIFSQFSMVWGYLQRVTITSTHYHRRYRTFSLSWHGL